MSYAPYPAYKDSGVPWLGQVPEGWEVKPIKYVSTFNDETLPDTTDPELMLNYVDISSVNLVEGIQRIEPIEFEKAPSRARRLVRHGDTIVSTVRTYLKAIAPVRHPVENMVVSTGFAVIRPDQTMNPDFLGYFIQSEGFVGEVVSKSTGVSYPAINPGDLVAISGVRPSIEEQTAIARFLDEKTAEIDDLIAKKEELLRLLAEQRTALITHAVTKGLNPDAPMNPSGIDWLGDVPEGWEVKPLKREVWYQEGPGIMAVDFRDEGVPLLRIRNLKPGRVELEGCNFLDPEMANGKWAHFQVEDGDRLISTSASTGLVSVVDADAVGAIPYTGIIRIRPLGDKMLPEFLEYFVSSELFFDQIDLLATGTTIQHFGPYHLNQMIMAVPPVEEQVMLVERLASDLGKLGETMGIVETALDRLKEYRTALITNAVTGKIKVA